jgi:hypothetical protein
MTNVMVLAVVYQFIGKLVGAISSKLSIASGIRPRSSAIPVTARVSHSHSLGHRDTVTAPDDDDTAAVVASYLHPDTHVVRWTRLPKESGAPSLQPKHAHRSRHRDVIVDSGHISLTHASDRCDDPDEEEAADDGWGFVRRHRKSSQDDRTAVGSRARRRSHSVGRQQNTGKKLQRKCSSPRQPDPVELSVSTSVVNGLMDALEAQQHRRLHVQLSLH